MTVFQSSVLFSSDSILVPLKHIESFTGHDEEEDEVIDRLKDDKTLIGRTLSGATYTFSMRTQIELYRGKYKMSEDVVEVRNAILERWISIVNGA